MGLKFADETTGLGMMRALYENGVWAFVAGFDQSVVQFKPGLLVDRDYCDEVLKRVENACIWFLRAMTEVLSGGSGPPDKALIDPIRDVARKGLESWGIADGDLQLIKHRENTVFKVTAADGRCFALRVHQAGLHDDDALRSELIWMRALRDDGFSVPRVLPTNDGELFAVVGEGNDASRCSLLEWVDGKLMNDLGRVEKGMQVELCDRYHRLGTLAARLHNHSQSWSPPPGFVRHCWDEDGLLGDEPRMGRFWDHPALTPRQRREFLKARIVLQGFLDKLGKHESKYGLIHADFLPDNIIVNEDKLTLIDFDDCGYGWHLYEMGTALLPQIKQPFFDDIVAAYLEGYRSERAFSSEDEESLPAFLMICSLHYLGWFQKRGENIEHADRLAAEIIHELLKYIPQLMQQLTLVQRALVNVLVWKF